MLEHLVKAKDQGATEGGGGYGARQGASERNPNAGLEVSPSPRTKARRHEGIASELATVILGRYAFTVLNKYLFFDELSIEGHEWHAGKIAASLRRLYFVFARLYCYHQTVNVVYQGVLGGGLPHSV